MSSTLNGNFPAGHLIDGGISESSMAHSYSPSDSSGSANPWLEIDLGSSQRVGEVQIYNRAGATSTMGRLNTFVVALSDSYCDSAQRVTCATYTAASTGPVARQPSVL